MVDRIEEIRYDEKNIDRSFSGFELGNRGQDC